MLIKKTGNDFATGTKDFCEAEGHKNDFKLAFSVSKLG